MILYEIAMVINVFAAVGWQLIGHDMEKAIYYLLFAIFFRLLIIIK
jgi:hypothetical protein